MQKFDIVIKNGHVIDPMNQIYQKNCNIAIHEGKIAQIGDRGCQLDDFVSIPEQPQFCEFEVPSGKNITKA